MKMETMTHSHHDPRPAPPFIAPKPAPVPMFGFDFKRRYSGLYTNRHERFVLREEHVDELKRVATEYNRARPRHVPVLSMSEVVNAALDFVFEHPVALARLGTPEEFRDGLAKEIYRKAFFHFAFNGLI
jgi:hypothetical protein